MKSIKTLFVLLIALTVATTASAYNFTKDLELGSRGSDVTKLQEMLVGAGHLESDSVTGYFGPATELAVAKWQIANDIKPISGIFGAISRAIMASVPVANLSSASYMDEDPTPLTYMQARNAVGRLVEVGLLAQRQYSRALEALTRQQTIKLTSPNNGERFKLATGIDNTLSGQEDSVYVIDWSGSSLGREEQAKDVVKAFLEKKVGSEYVTIGRIPALAYGSIHSLAGYIAPQNCNHTYFSEGNWENSCVNSDKYEIVPAGQYFIRVLDTTTGMSDRSDKPVVFYKSEEPTVPSTKLQVTVKSGGMADDNLALYNVMAPNDSGKIAAWKITVETHKDVEFSMKGGGGFGTDTMIIPSNGKDFNWPLYFRNSTNTSQKVVVKVWAYLTEDAAKYMHESEAHSFGAVSFAIASNPVGALNLKLESNPDRSLPEGFKAYTLKSPNDSGKVVVWKIFVDCPSQVLFYANGVNKCGEEFIVRTNGNPLNEGINFKNTSQTETLSAKINVWTYSRFEAITPETGSQYQLQSGQVGVRLAPDSVDTIPTPVVNPVTPEPKKLTSAEICAVVQKPTASVCAKSYPISKGVEKMTGYVYNGFKYDISYKKNVNSSGAVCRDTCTAKVY